MQWYVLRVQSNKEMQVRDALEQKVQREHLNDIIGRIEVPAERVKRIRGNKQTVHTRKLYPGYVFMEMETTGDGRAPEQAWFMIKETSGVGDFIGVLFRPQEQVLTEIHGLPAELVVGRAVILLAAMIELPLRVHLLEVT